MYRKQAHKTKSIPMVDNATEQIKKEFWKSCILCDECNEAWALAESKQYANLDVYLDQIHQIHYRKPLTAEKILDCFDDIEKLTPGDKIKNKDEFINFVDKISNNIDSYKEDRKRVRDFYHKYQDGTSTKVFVDYFDL